MDRLTVFWDFDGTLVSSPHMWSCSMYRAMKEICPESGATIEDIRRFTPYIFTWSYPERDYGQYKGEKWWDFMNIGFMETYTALGLSGAEAERACVRAREIINLRENYNIFPDSIPALERCRAVGAKNVILSNNIPELEDIMKDMGLHGYFDGFVVSAIEGYDKPRSELFEIGKERYPAERYVMIGDNPDADVCGGRAAGMKTVLVRRGGCDSADLSIPDLSHLPSPFDI